MSNKLVIFGPWTGEFSYELQWWIPEIRKKRKTEFETFDSAYIGYDGRSFLCQDFVDHYISYPKELESTLNYSSNWAQVLSGDGSANVGIPRNIREFVSESIMQFQDKYQEILIYEPTSLNKRCYENFPYGEFIHYAASEKILNDMKAEISFKDSSRKTVSILARVRYRSSGRTAFGEVLDNGLRRCADDWNSDHWEIFIDRLINEMNLNVCVIDIPAAGSNAGSLSFVDSDVYMKNRDHIKSIKFHGPDSVERQVALLQLTDCSVYGATGTAILPYFTKTPVFTQQIKEFGYRMKFDWQRKLSDNLTNVCIFDKYARNDIYNSSCDELFLSFRNFFETLMKDGVYYGE